MSSDLSRELRSRRQARGWTLAELARRAGTSAPTLHRYETGWRRFELYTLEKLAKALGCRLEVRFEPLAREDLPASGGRAIEQLRRLFWDRRLTERLLARFPEWVVKRVLEYGTLADVRTLRDHLGREPFLETVARIHLDSRRARGFWEHMLRQEGLPCTREFSRTEAESCWKI